MAEQPTETSANTAVAGLTDDLMIDILSRLPVKSLCRCKCVSPHWRDLISHPDHRRRLPQTLAGFFGKDWSNGRVVWRFTSLCDARQPPLVCAAPFSFMPGYVTIVDACNGLLLCRTPTGLPQHSPYVVCNPATKSWVTLPASGNQGDDGEYKGTASGNQGDEDGEDKGAALPSSCNHGDGSEDKGTASGNHSDDDEGDDEDDELPVARLGFDPAVSQYFYVFVFVERDDHTVAGVKIYSSKIGAWSYYTGFPNCTLVFHDSPSVFLNGVLHLSRQFEVVGIDVKGDVWSICLPEDPGEFDENNMHDPGLLHRYQGLLCYMNLCDNETNLSIWVIEESDHGDEWVLKHQVTIQQLTEKICPPETNYFSLLTVHPDCNWILCMWYGGHTNGL
ncbi:unnamed protein product [Urochloa decumbens]|uniref:F-box domain-containing protein n=1 Tax=Urochloa decumbens TaxID=240449 RepID=A0ABC9DAG6_9POAL